MYLIKAFAIASLLVSQTCSDDPLQQNCPGYSTSALYTAVNDVTAVAGAVSGLIPKVGKFIAPAFTLFDVLFSIFHPSDLAKQIMRTATCLMADKIAHEDALVMLRKVQDQEGTLTKIKQLIPEGGFAGASEELRNDYWTSLLVFFEQFPSAEFTNIKYNRSNIQFLNHVITVHLAGGADAMVACLAFNRSKDECDSFRTMWCGQYRSYLLYQKKAIYEACRWRTDEVGVQDPHIKDHFNQKEVYCGSNCFIDYLTYTNNLERDIDKWYDSLALFPKSWFRWAGFVGNVSKEEACKPYTRPHENVAAAVACKTVEDTILLAYDPQYVDCGYLTGMTDATLDSRTKFEAGWKLLRSAADALDPNWQTVNAWTSLATDEDKSPNIFHWYPYYSDFPTEEFDGYGWAAGEPVIDPTYTPKYTGYLSIGQADVAYTPGGASGYRSIVRKYNPRPFLPHLVLLCAVPRVEPSCVVRFSGL